MLRTPSFRLLLLSAVVVVLSGCPSFETDRLPEADTTQTEPPEDQPEQTEPGPVDADAPEEFTTTDSGLQYRIRRKGTGDMPQPEDTVEVNYRGWLDDGTVFDSSYRRGASIRFRLQGVIAGWTEGLQHVREGGMIELVIPAKLGYGSDPPPGSGIPSGATLHFLVELVKIGG